MQNLSMYEESLRKLLIFLKIRWVSILTLFWTSFTLGLCPPIVCNCLQNPIYLCVPKIIKIGPAIKVVSFICIIVFTYKKIKVYWDSWGSTDINRYVGNFVHEYLGMQKLFSKWVLRKLIINHKQKQNDWFRAVFCNCISVIIIVSLLKAILYWLMESNCIKKKNFLSMLAYKFFSPTFTFTLLC